MKRNNVIAALLIVIGALAIMLLAFMPPQNDLRHAPIPPSDAQKIIGEVIPSSPKSLLGAEIPLPIGQIGSWNMVFDDEFEGATLDPAKWKPNWFGSSNTSVTEPINSLERNCYDPANVSTVDGALTFVIKPNMSSGCQDKAGKTAPYSSGMVSSNGKFNTAYGYFEAKIWTPSGVRSQSVWPAFWTDGQNWPTNGEIDILEAYGTDASSSYHYHYSGGGPGGNTTVSGSTTGWHVYAANWEPGKITWYYDGKQVWQYTTGIVSVPHYIIVNLGTIGTQVDLSTTDKSIMRIDYVRVWKGSGAAVTPTPMSATQTVVPTSTLTQTLTRTPTPAIIPSITYTVTSTPIPPTKTEVPTIIPTLIVDVRCDPKYLPVCVYRTDQLS